MSIDADDITTFPEYIETPDEEDGTRVQEIPPVIPTPKPSERFKEHFDKVKGLRKRLPAPARKPRLPRKNVARVALTEFLSAAWAGLGQFAASYSEPVGRVMTIQAPVAGAVLEDVVKDTVVDRMLQPVARVSRGGEIAFALIGPPVLVALMQQNPEKAGVYIPVLRRALHSWIKVAKPKLDELAKQQQEFKEEYGTEIDQMIEFFMTGALPQPPE